MFDWKTQLYLVNNPSNPFYKTDSSALIERGQFAQNNVIYESGKFDFKDEFQGSFVEWMLYETEKLHGEVPSPLYPPSFFVYTPFILLSIMSPSTN